MEQSDFKGFGGGGGAGDKMEGNRMRRCHIHSTVRSIKANGFSSEENEGPEGFGAKLLFT